MNRKEATNHIGKQIRVVDPLLGNYIGELVDIIAEPRKPWRGKVKIQAIEKFPIQNLSNIDKVITHPSFTHMEVYEFVGSKIEPINDDRSELNFETSLKGALLDEINFYHNEKKKITGVLNKFEQEYKKIEPDFKIEEDPALDFQYYTIEKNKDETYLIDENNNSIPLSHCPFEFEINVDHTWTTVHFEKGLTFKDANKKQYKLTNGEELRLNKEQFDPYQIFINELEKPALDSLSNGLQKYNIAHEHCVNCHNTLLDQYLATNDDRFFKGVNFISYQNAQQTLLVQHHYEREISTEGDDITYDRFEFTNDKGKRLLMTYTTESR